jgi:hypothetical protein
MDKVISFSLWGTNPKYTVGAIRNAELAPIIYPGWKARFYVANSVPNQIVYAIEDMKHVQIIFKNTVGDWTGMFWRFEAAYDPTVEISIFRDTDSRINKREQAAVEQWITSDKLFHIMRDHPFHSFPILGGMWGVKNNSKFDIKKLLEEFMSNKASNIYGTDYNFLGNVLFPLIRERDILVHDEFFDKKPFPTKRENYQFVGQVFDEKENTVKEHLEALKKNEII